MICRTDLDGVYPFKRSVEGSLNYYLLPKLYVKLWLCPSAVLIYMHSFSSKSSFIFITMEECLLPSPCAWPPWNWQMHIQKLNLEFFSLYFLIAIHVIRIVTATFKATKSWFRSEILWSSSNSSHGLKKLSQLSGVEVLLPHSLWFLKAISDMSPSKHLC